MTLASPLLLGCSLGGVFQDEKELDCSPGQTVELGAPYYSRPAHFRTSGGLLRFEVRDLPTTVLGEVTKTTLYFGDAADPPDIDPVDPELPDNAEYRLSVELDRPGVIDLPPGEYWALTFNGRIRAVHCEDVEVEVVPG